MFSIYGTPKPFRGPIEVTQRNAIKSWTLLHPDCEVILAGNEYGTKEVAEEMGAVHIPDVAVNEHGTPLENSVKKMAESVARHRLMCILASDIILMSDTARAIGEIGQTSKKFVVFSQRWNLSVTKPIDFDSEWEEELRSQLAQRGRLYARTGMDYMFYPRGLLGEAPPFAVGRRGYDNWLLYTARVNGADLVDVTPVVQAVHQDHDYSYHPQGTRGVMYGPEAQQNTKFAGSRPHRFMIKDRTHVLTAGGLHRVQDLWRIWRFLRTFEAIYSDAALPVLSLVRAINFLIDAAAGVYYRACRVLKVRPPHELTTGR